MALVCIHTEILPVNLPIPCANAAQGSRGNGIKLRQQIFHLKAQGQTNIEIIWDGQILDTEQVTISAPSKQPEPSTQFIPYITDAAQKRDYDERNAIGPMRQSRVDMVRVNKKTSNDLRSHVPTYPTNLERAIFRDAKWYARTRERLGIPFEI